ncbi:hypothetical protein RhiirA4_473308 [Rhizophagus irregularis]|uniref:Uncharacterized protein n=1 Tax=Rhizophagus irregularis TaxID=588596 RepID=A0A2I1H6H3_9GLOM|nr:hypothetical protein RhiirA4_473308 [Rhizophagus irregularis]
MCDRLGSFKGFALVPSEESQLTPWPIVGTALILNVFILYPTHKRKNFGLISALWALVGGILSLWHVIVAVQSPMIIAFKMPFGLPLGVGSNIIRLTLDDGTSNYLKRWKTLYDVVRGKSPEFTDTKEELNEKDLKEEAEKGKRTRKQAKTGRGASDRRTIIEISRFSVLVINFILITVGLVRVWLWWYPFDAMSDFMCLANFTEKVHTSYDYLTCGTTVTDWSSATYSNCILFEPAVGWFLIIVYSVIYTGLLLGILFMRGHAIWADGIVGSATLIVLSELQSAYSTQGLCVQFVATLMGLPPSLIEILGQQVLSHRSLINLWWHRFSYTNWLIQLFTIHG